MPNIILTGEAAADADEKGVAPAAAPQASWHVPGAGSMGMVSRKGTVGNMFWPKPACMVSCSVRTACAAQLCVLCHTVCLLTLCLR